MQDVHTPDVSKGFHGHISLGSFGKLSHHFLQPYWVGLGLFQPSWGCHELCLSKRRLQWGSFPKLLGQGLVNFICKELDSISDHVDPTISLSTTQICLCALKADLGNAQKSGCGWVPSQLDLWTPKFEFQIIFMYHKILCFFWFFF